LQPHRAAYDVTMLDHGKPGAGAQAATPSNSN